jgi:hypothetical protein
MDVTETDTRNRRLEDFNRRRSRGTGGKFFTRDDIQKRNAKRTTDVIRGTPGIRFVGDGIRFQSSKGQCIPVIWLDTPLESLLARCMTMSGRPLFRDEVSFRALYAQRLPSYQLADYRVDGSMGPSLVVAEILRLNIFDGPREKHLVVEKPRP